MKDLNVEQKIAQLRALSFVLIGEAENMVDFIDSESKSGLEAVDRLENLLYLLKDELEQVEEYLV